MMPPMPQPLPPDAAAARDDARDGGFTLLEVLVAFAIAALALGVLFEGAVGGIRSTRIADRTEEALSRARSHLAAVGQGTPLGPGTQEGDDGSGFHWSVRIRPLQSALTSSSRVVLYAVQVTESWSEGDARDDATRSVVLRTERLGVAHGDAS